MRLTGDPERSSPRRRPELLLFLCVANVCRSPAMQFLTGCHLQERGLETSWQLVSAGTAVSARQQMCNASAAYVADLPGGKEFARTHRSQPVSKDLVERAGIILVTAQEERSVVARLAPDARARTFTLIEAALLAETAATHSTDTSSLEIPGSERPALESLVTAMHSGRGRIGQQRTSMPPRRPFSRPREPGNFDIGDVHKGARKRHGPVLTDLAWASEHLAEAFASMLGPARS